MSEDHSPIYSSIASDEDLKEILEMFVQEMPQRIARFREELESGNWEGLKVAIHQFKGAAGSHGFFTLSAMAKTLEDAIKNGKPAEEIAATTRALEEMCLRATTDPDPNDVN